MQLIAEGSEEEEDDSDAENHHININSINSNTNNTQGGNPQGSGSGSGSGGDREGERERGRERKDDVLRRDAVEDFLLLLDASEKKRLPEVLLQCIPLILSTTPDATINPLMLFPLM